MPAQVPYAPRLPRQVVRVAAGWMVKQAAENKALVIALRQTLDNGEAEAIALATEMQPEVVLLDDKLARRMAQRLGVTVTGTLGVLLRAKQVGLIVQLRPLITRLQSEGDYYIVSELIEKALLAAGESARSG